jgi:hypothetical protein
VVFGISELTVDVYPSTYPNTSASSCTLQVFSNNGSQLIFNDTLPTNGTVPIRFNVNEDELTSSYELRAYMDWSTVNSEPFITLVNKSPEGLY